MDNIEFQFTAAAAVPVPGSLPLAVAGFGLMALGACCATAKSSAAQRRIAS